ncbi:hypothetical protein VQL36_15960 [Chengkuizengella sp. SCS-71B]|uniref:hypothetical protein n=1 Tax=Chengkuizengella sp. SCS-71B TaxID=3115290 RepID=UPI0032C23902
MTLQELQNKQKKCKPGHKTFILWISTKEKNKVKELSYIEVALFHDVYGNEEMSDH